MMIMLKRITLSYTFALAALAAGAQAAPTLEQIAEIIGNHSCTKGTVQYEVMLPSAADPVTYTIDLQSLATPDDTLSACEYLIDWSLHRNGAETRGFSAYYGGNHLRYSGGRRLQEYHHADDPAPFAGDKGVQRQAQFIDLLAPYVAERFRIMDADTAYTYTVRRSGPNIVVSGTQSMMGYEVLQYTYTLDGTTMMPVQTDLTYNPASISEQTVTANYQWAENPQCLELTEEILRDTYPEVFASYRQSNFHVRNLVGNPLPAIAARTDVRTRWQHNKGEGLAYPTLLVFIDPAVASTAQTVADVRAAVETLPFAMETVYLMATNDGEAAAAAVGDKAAAETVLMSARSAIADCGITAFPTLLFCAADGTVRDIEIGANNTLRDIVVQKATLCQ